MSDEEFETELQEFTEMLRCMRRIKDKGRRAFMLPEIRRTLQRLTRD